MARTHIAERSLREPFLLSAGARACHGRYGGNTRCIGERW